MRIEINIRQKIQELIDESIPFDKCKDCWYINKMETNETLKELCDYHILIDDLREVLRNGQ